MQFQTVQKFDTINCFLDFLICRCYVMCRKLVGLHLVSVQLGLMQQRLAD